MSISNSDNRLDRQRALRAVFFGTECRFSRPVIRRLLASDLEIVAHVLPGSSRQIHPFDVHSPGLASAGSATLPMAQSSRRLMRTAQTITLNEPRHPDSIAMFQALDADIGVVCCYPARLPVPVIESFRMGAINVHPSLLPRYRGPEPLFWQYRLGETGFGVTIHRVDAGLDTGGILAQEQLHVPLGTPGDDVEVGLAETGARSVIETIEALRSGQECEVPQNESESSYYSWPTSTDLLVDPDKWQIEHAMHFVQGVRPLGYRPVLQKDGLKREIMSISLEINFERSSSSRIEFADGPALVRFGRAV